MSNRPRYLSEAEQTTTVVVSHVVATKRFGIHKASRAAVMRKALAAAGLDTEPLLWQIKWNNPATGQHTVTFDTTPQRG